MGERELREKYGGKLAKAINRAIRAELDGGNAALDTLTRLAGPARHSGWKLPDGKPTEEAAAYSRHKKSVVDKMEAQIRRKWGIPLEVPQLPMQKTRPRKPAQRANPRSHKKPRPSAR